MADFVKGIFGGQKPVAAPAPAGDDDFADYAGAPDPEPTSLVYEAVTSSVASPVPAPTAAVGPKGPYTAWYRVWERTTLDDFKVEMYILPFLFVIVALHLWGTRANRRKARQWMRAHHPVLQQEFTQVGYFRPQASVDDVSEMGLANATEKAMATAYDPEKLLKEKKIDEYMSYATGRQNVAFVDFKITLLKRYNPLMRFGEALLSVFFESLPPPEERLEATAYVFDGDENKIVPKFIKGEGKVPSSTFDGFVFAIVHKDLMKRMREDRYDLSLTSTKDHPKLPLWTTVMSESAEVTDKLLTPELIKAVHDAGDKFEALVVSDQPLDQPKTLTDTVPRKRIHLSVKLSSDYTSTMPLFTYFLRLSDFLVANAHFRPEAMRRIKQTRDEQIAKIKRAEDELQAEERRLQGEKLKKEQRDQKLSRMSADEQKKYLEKEREKDLRRSQKRKTIKG